MELERCPYDMSSIVVEASGDGFVIACGACGAAWEMEGSSIRRLRAPDPVTMNAVREGLFTEEVLLGKRVVGVLRDNDAAR